MRFADLLGEPDDDGNAPGSSTTEGPGVPASGGGAAPAGASGSFGGAPAPDPSPPMDDDLARWFTEEVAEIEPVDFEVTDPAPESVPPRGRALASATGALDEPETSTVDAEAPAPSGVARDDLLPARPSGHGRKRR
jgi:hypothetical protein